MKKILAAAVCLCMLAVMVIGCDTDAIKIGVYEPVTEESAAGGNLELKGIELAHSAGKKVNGKSIRLIKKDIVSNKSKAGIAISDLVDKDGVIAIIGPWGSQYAQAASSNIVDKKIPSILATCTNPELTRYNDYMFRICHTDTYEGSVAANYAFTKLGAKSAALIIQKNSNYTSYASDGFKELFAKLVGTRAEAIKEIKQYDSTTTDFTEQLTAIKDAAPDVIYAPGDPAMVLAICKKAKELGITIPIITNNLVETKSFITDGGDAVEGLIFVSFYASEALTGTASKEFMEAYNKAEGVDADAQATGIVASGYDAYNVLIEALTKASSLTSEGILAALNKIEDFDGATGKITFGEKRDAQKEAFVKKIEGGKFVYVATISDK